MLQPSAAIIAAKKRTSSPKHRAEKWLPVFGKNDATTRASRAECSGVQPGSCYDDRGPARRGGGFLRAASGPFVLLGSGFQVASAFKIAIVGSGPAGLSAAAHAARLGLSH